MTKEQLIDIFNAVVVRFEHAGSNWADVGDPEVVAPEIIREALSMLTPSQVTRLGLDDDGE